MKASVIIPTLPPPPQSKAAEKLRRALDSVGVASAPLGDEVETIVIRDELRKGPSWARNRGLELARGDYVFFCDADDSVEPDFLTAPLAALERTGADLAFFTYEGGPRLEAFELSGSDRIRDHYLPAFFGYSNDDVRRWNRGGRLTENKQLGQVWRCAYRREFLERRRIRFDEAITLFEDAAFLSHCVTFAERTVSLPDRLYRYDPSPDGNLATGWRGRRNWDYKFLALDFRERLDALTGGEIWRFCEASCVFSALELLKARYRLREYLARARVRSALRSFPLSWRHPMVAAAVSLLRCL